MLDVLGLVTAVWMFATAAAPASAATADGYEQLSGFSEVLSVQIEKAIGTGKLPDATGYPVEPGVFVTMSLDEVRIFERPVASLKNGRVDEKKIAKSCRSGCPWAFWAAFSDQWRRQARTRARSGFEHPKRILWACHENLPAHTMIQSAYAAMETWPESNPPSLYLLTNAGAGGTRARFFYLMPPEGLPKIETDIALGLRVHISSGGQYRISARSGAFAFAGDVQGISALTHQFGEIKRKYPGKDSLILEVEPDVTTQELATVMGASLELYPRLILSQSGLGQ